jgi:hypothetical protein
LERNAKRQNRLKEEVMQYRTIEQMRQVAAIHPNCRTMTRAERLERWAEALERRGGTVRALREIEFVPWSERRARRAHGSALSVAFADPVLRESGLSGDRYEDGLAFFELRDDEAHLILCSCYAGETLSAREVAARVRHAATLRRGVALSLGLPLVLIASTVVGVMAASL